MPIATPETYRAMYDTAKREGYAYPAFNVTSSQTLNAVLLACQEANTDAIIQVSNGGANYFSGQAVEDRVTGSIAFAEFAHVVAQRYDINVALHTDHCPKNMLDSWVRPLIEYSQERVREGKGPLFNSHMWDGSAVPLNENLVIAKELLAQTNAAHQILEIEVGVVGGEEDGIVGQASDKMYTTIEDGIKTVEALGTGENGRYTTALTFGNVHGVYKPGNVRLRPEILKEIQDAVGQHVGKDKPFDLVFHGGSGSTDQEIKDAVSYGVVKMNIDTDTQYAFTRPIVHHLFTQYDGALKIEGEVGNKKVYDPRSWGKAAERGMADRVKEAIEILGATGKTVG